MQKPRRRRRRLTSQIEAAMNSLLLLNPAWSPAEVQRRLVDEYGDQAPLLRTVQRSRRDLVALLPSNPWRASEASPEEFALVAPVLAFMVSDSEGQTTSITEAQAAEIASLRRRVPDLPLLTAYRLARLYLYRKVRNELTDDLDSWLVFAPYRGREQEQAYEEAVTNGWVQRPPFGWLWLNERESRRGRAADKIATEVVDEHEAQQREGEQQ